MSDVWNGESALDGSLAIVSQAHQRDDINVNEHSRTIVHVIVVHEDENRKTTQKIDSAEEEKKPATLNKKLAKYSSTQLQRAKYIKK